MRLGVGAALVRGTLLPGDVEVVDGRIAAVGLAGGDRDLVAAPGFVDLQVNGFGGVDLLEADADGWRRAGDALLETGVTAYQPTFITSGEERLVAALAGVPRRGPGPRILGVHLEGPFIAPEKLGTHPAEARRDPDLALAERLLAAGPATYMTLAPERPGALALVDALRARGVTVSLGHSNATAEEADAAFDRGVTTVTHLFNAMRSLGHRDPGIAAAALARDDVVVQLIVDGVHVDDHIVQLVRRAARGRLALVTDAMAGAGLGDGRYRLGEVDVEVRDGVARRADGVLAGSVITMPESVRRLVGLGATLAEALGAATEVPAAVVGRDDVGTLAVGRPADVVVLDDRLELRRVLVDGDARVVA